MAVTVTNQSTPLASKLVKDDAPGGTAANNTTGTSGALYAIEITNPNAYSVYFKIADAATATAGTTAATVVVMCPAAGASPTTKTYVIPTGVAFDTGFCHWCVREAAESGTTSPGSAVTATYVTS
tara:strand:+ start:295 stop:669 length:375 start_codon:yes stop_codon:yes gene_type:complete